MILRWAEHLMASRAPDFIVGGVEHPYMNRWWVIPRNRWFNIYLHEFLNDDEDEALHDHPWINLSILLTGRYLEYTFAGVFLRTAGCMKFRLPTQAHRLALLGERTITLFITGPVVRTWGFHCPKGWVPWKRFVELKGNVSTQGKGCAD